jgi:hypothetical protein
MEKMKKYRVHLLDKTGAEVVSHNLYAEDSVDANKKANVLLSASLNPYVKTFTVHEIK